MTQHFELRDFFRLASRPLLEEFFIRKGVLPDFSWGTGKSVNEEALFEAFSATEAAQQQQIITELRDIHDMSGGGFTRGVLNEANFHKSPEAIAAINAQRSHLNRAFWVAIQAPALIPNARRLAEIDKLPEGAWIQRGDMPLRPGPVDDSVVDDLRDALVSFFTKKQLRGKNCLVDGIRKGEDEIFYAYPEDHPDTKLEWRGAELVARVRNDPFRVIFRHNNQLRRLDVFLEGDRSLAPALQVVFSRAVLKEEITERYDAFKPVYELSNLALGHHKFQHSEGLGIADARLCKMRFVIEGEPWQRIILEADTSSQPGVLSALVTRTTDALPKSKLFLDQVCIKVRFHKRNGDRRAHTRTIFITYPNTLRLKRDDLGEKIEQMLLESKIDVTTASASQQG